MSVSPSYTSLEEFMQTGGESAETEREKFYKDLAVKKFRYQVQQDRERREREREENEFERLKFRYRVLRNALDDVDKKEKAIREQEDREVDLVERVLGMYHRAESPEERLALVKGFSDTPIGEALAELPSEGEQNWDEIESKILPKLDPKIAAKIYAKDKGLIADPSIPKLPQAELERIREYLKRDHTKAHDPRGIFGWKREPENPTQLEDLLGIDIPAGKEPTLEQLTTAAVRQWRRSHFSARSKEKNMDDLMLKEIAGTLEETETPSPETGGSEEKKEELNESLRKIKESIDKAVDDLTEPFVKNEEEGPSPEEIRKKAMEFDKKADFIEWLRSEGVPVGDPAAESRGQIPRPQEEE